MRTTLTDICRDEGTHLRMPTRLLELVQSYPYSKSAQSDEFLPRPRFSTRRYDALFVRIETEVSGPTNDKAKLHPLHLIVEALKAQPPKHGENEVAWDKIKKAAIAEAEEEQIPPDAYPAPSRVFADETIRLLSLIPGNPIEKEQLTPKFTLLPLERVPTQQSPSIYDGKTIGGTSVVSVSVSTNGHARSNGLLSPSTEVVVTDWTQFASAGFQESAPIPKILAGTLLDKDVEKTEPTTPRKSSKKRKAVSPVRGRRPLEDDKATVAVAAPAPAAEEVKTVSKSTMVTVVQLDETFIDFWGDALLDPISST
jgi:hypothetical protein